MKQIKITVIFFILITFCHELQAQEGNIDFVTYSNGTMADSRIAPEIADIIIKRFYAIENGDIQAFRATGSSIQDGADMYQHAGFIIQYFGDIIGLDFHTYGYDFDNYDKYNNMLYLNFYPPQKRNMWASLEKIEIIEAGYGFGMKATILNYKGEELIYYIGTKLIFDENDFIDLLFDNIERFSSLSEEWSFGRN